MGLSTVALAILSAGTWWLLLEEKRPRVVLEESRRAQPELVTDVQEAALPVWVEVATPAPEESAAPEPVPEKHSAASAAQRSSESPAEPPAIRAVEAKTVPAKVRARLQERLAQAREREARTSWGW